MPSSSETDISRLISDSPYYTVQIVPPSPVQMSLPEVRNIVSENAVSLRGWDFPHVAEGDTFTGDTYIFGLVDWGRHRELWRAYMSGQFVYLGNIWDVEPEVQAQLLAEIRRWALTATNDEKASVAGALSFIGVIYSITEFYIFAARWSSALQISGPVRVRVALKGVERWALAAGDPSVIWHSFHQSRIPDITSNVEVEVAKLVGDPILAARLAIREVFSKFNWHDIADTTIAQWQEKIVKRRF